MELWQLKQLVRMMEETGLERVNFVQRIESEDLAVTYKLLKLHEKQVSVNTAVLRSEDDPFVFTGIISLMNHYKLEGE